ncbi:hypothetical protein FHG87_004725 [Trinorchestia longiramus]|nr:hypothetical protein FHG87_004725 [Trinorchestia longiramus]
MVERLPDGRTDEACGGETAKSGQVVRQLVGELVRQVGELVRQVGELVKQVGELGELVRQGRETTRWMGWRMRDYEVEELGERGDGGEADGRSGEADGGG